MNLICLDLEMNQPSNKIIELGYVIFNAKTGNQLLARSLVINPQEPINPDIITLTGLDDEKCASGTTLSTGYDVMCRDMARFNVSHTPVQWGAGDAHTLRTQLELSAKDYIFRTRTFDVKSLFQIHQLYSGGKVVMGLEPAVETLGLTFQGKPHRAVNDAINTKNVFVALGKQIVLANKVRKALS